VRVQDNYVVQWNDPDHNRAVPAGVTLVAPEFTAEAGADARFEPLPDRDAEPWFKFNPGHIDVCNVPLPVRTPAPGG
jgi:hypothetical protein